MTIFAISSDTNSTQLKEKLKSIYGSEFLEVDSHLCLVSTDKAVTAEQVSKNISGENPLNPAYGSYIVFSVSSYYGFHSKSVWEWMQAKGV